jgi:predicted DNA-binding protein YlxM (UPF0122 family)
MYKYRIKFNSYLSHDCIEHLKDYARMKQKIGISLDDYSLSEDIKNNVSRGIMKAWGTKPIHNALTLPGMAGFKFENCYILKLSKKAHIHCCEEIKETYLKVMLGYNKIPKQIFFHHKTIEETLEALPIKYEIIWLDYCSWPEPLKMKKLIKLLYKHLVCGGVVAMTRTNGRHQLSKTDIKHPKLYPCIHPFKYNGSVPGKKGRSAMIVTAYMKNKIPKSLVTIEPVVEPLRLKTPSTFKPTVCGPGRKLSLKSERLKQQVVSLYEKFGHILSQKHKDIIDLRYYQNKSLLEVVRKLGINSVCYAPYILNYIYEARRQMIRHQNHSSARLINKENMIKLFKDYGQCLKSNIQEMFKLHHIERLKLKEVGRRLGTSGGAVASTLTYAKVRMLKEQAKSTLGSKIVSDYVTDGYNSHQKTVTQTRSLYGLDKTV